MDSIFELITSRDLLVGILVTVSVLATLITLFGPSLQMQQIKLRARNVTAYRQKLQAERKLNLGKSDQKKSIRNESAQGIVLKVADRLKVLEIFDSEAAAAKLAMMGQRGERPVAIFMFSRLVVPIAVGVIGAIYIYIGGAVEASSSNKLLMLVGVFAFGFFAPNIYVSNAITKRQTAMKLGLPDALDLLIICVESGMSTELAFQKVAEEFSRSHPVLSEEFMLTTAELSYMPERRIAYENMARRTPLEELKALVTALIQSDTYGTPVGMALRVIAEEGREKRMQAAEKKAAALPPKLTVPMIVFFIPVLFVIIMGPVFITLTGNDVESRDDVRIIRDGA